MFLGLDRRLDHGNMVRVGDQGDCDVVLCHRLLESGCVVHVEADGLGVGKVAREVLGRGQRTTGDGDVHAGLGQDLDGGRGDEAGAEEEGGLRHPDGLQAARSL